MISRMIVFIKGIKVTPFKAFEFNHSFCKVSCPTFCYFNSLVINCYYFISPNRHFVFVFIIHMWFYISVIMVIIFLTTSNSRLYILKEQFQDSEKEMLCDTRYEHILPFASFVWLSLCITKKLFINLLLYHNRRVRISYDKLLSIDIHWTRKKHDC
jgi:hypothetical protein